MFNTIKYYSPSSTNIQWQGKTFLEGKHTNSWKKMTIGNHHLFKPYFTIIMTYPHHKSPCFFMVKTPLKTSMRLRLLPDVRATAMRVRGKGQGHQTGVQHRFAGPGRRGRPRRPRRGSGEKKSEVIFCKKMEAMAFFSMIYSYNNFYNISNNGDLP